eukprot:jgi/Bigna1/91305/estExt_fgenesh1_pg.C_960017
MTATSLLSGTAIPTRCSPSSFATKMRLGLALGKSTRRHFAISRDCVGDGKLGTTWLRTHAGHTSLESQSRDQQPAPRDVLVISMENVLMPAKGSSSDGLFKGIHYALSGCGMPYYVITSETKEDASSKLTSQGNLLEDFTADSPRLYASPDRLQALLQVSERVPAGSRLHFVDSDPKENLPFHFDTRRDSAICSFAVWAMWSNEGFSTDEVGGSYLQQPYQCIGLTEFVELSKMGIIMAYGIDSHRQYALEQLYRNPSKS